MEKKIQVLQRVKCARGGAMTPTYTMENRDPMKLEQASRKSILCIDQRQDDRVQQLRQQSTSTFTLIVVLGTEQSGF